MAGCRRWRRDERNPEVCSRSGRAVGSLSAGYGFDARWGYLVPSLLFCLVAIVNI